ncbi:salicylate hydroxylase, partial [Thioclava sp. BHET1]
MRGTTFAARIKMKEKAMKTLIVGEGLAGLAASLAFSRRGLEYDLVERSSEIRSEGAGIFLLGNAARALDQLGLLTQIKSISHQCRSQTIFDQSGRLLHRLDTGRFWGAVGPCLSISRPALHQALHQELGAERISTGKELVRILSEPKTHHVLFSDGTTGQYDLIVGADGIRSTTRSLLFPGLPGPRKLGQRCWRFVTQNTLE